ncbi:DUF4097 family beta strand repeat-containing protein [Streptomyces sp. NBC_00094]|uniref:DUF4097 family beta strand repeat-containing protein n=1 Tax=Streptomyces sp. NBC_00094 TaxID=2903620 RepID=UPI00224D97AC|nr:DUF4097 family beta strand repeat-containing protein [Streptomyces sp. NBC_00094]MCX5390440.1 DUF4097 domain-containing protein [Streptomyces sp. NBC_00094]
MGARHPFLAAGGALVALLTLSGCGSADVGDAPVERKTFAFDGSTLTVDSDDSALVITPADVDDVVVERQVDGWVFIGSGPDATWKLADGRLTLRVDCDAVASNCDAVHRIQVPRGVAVAVEDDNGDVRAEGFATPLTVRSDNGDVRVIGSTGALDLGTDNGDLTVEGDTTAPGVLARTDNGDVRITLGAVPRRVDVATENGDVHVTLPTAEYDATGASDSGDVRLDVPRRDGSEHSVSVRSDNGDIDVRTAN